MQTPKLHMRRLLKTFKNWLKHLPVWPNATEGQDIQKWKLTRVNMVQRSMNRCMAALPLTFKQNHWRKGTQAETMLNLTKVNTQTEDPKAEEK